MNAKVRDIFIGVTDRGIITGKIYFDLADGSGQANSYKNLGDKYLSEFVEGICNVFDVQNIFDIVGKPCVISGSDTHIDDVSNYMDYKKTYKF